jgi:iron complex outermembrane receptor protein
MNCIIKTRLVLQASVLVLLISATPLMAQVSGGTSSIEAPTNELEEIIITANLVETNNQKTSTSVAVVSGAEIAQSGLTSLDEVARDLPNVVISSSAVGLSATIRGIGASPIPADIGGSSGVANLYDGLYTLQEQAGRTGFYDVQRFEVLRGPQGTLYGRNAEGGVFNVITNDPTHSLEGSASAEFGNYDLYRVTGVANIPLTNDLAIRVAAAYVNRDGYLSNGQDDNVAGGVRVKALYTPNSRISLLLAGDYTHTGGEDLGTVLSTTYPLSNPWTSPNQPNQRTSGDGYRLWSNFRVDTEIGNLTIIPAYQSTGPESHVQYTGAYDNVGSNPHELIQKSLETRFASEPNSPIGWLVGTYLYHYKQVATGFDTTTDPITGHIITDPYSPYLSDPTLSAFIPYFNKTTTQTSDSAAAFAQVTVPIAQSVRLIGGVRDSADHSSIQTIWDLKAGGTSVFYPLTRGKWTHLDWKAASEYDVTPDSMLYATVATGYRPGGFDPLPTGGFNLESLMSYELGSKNEFFERRVRVNASVFYYDYSHYQVVTFVPGGPQGAEPLVLNAQKAAEYGGELETTWKIAQRDRLNASVGFLHSRIESPVAVSNPDGASPASLIGIEGNTLANSPEWMLVGSYHHGFALPGGGEIGIDPTARYVSSYHITPAEGHTSDQSGYAKYDLAASYTSPDLKWILTAFGRNLSNVAVKSAYLPAPYLLLQPPRTFGAVLNVKF